MALVVDPLTLNPPAFFDTLTETEITGDDVFPGTVWYLKDEAKNKYGAFHIDCQKAYPDPIDCMAVFRTAEEADQFGDLIESCFMIPYQCTFDEARDVAKESGKDFKALALMDRWDTPLLHFIA